MHLAPNRRKARTPSAIILMSRSFESDTRRYSAGVFDIVKKE